MATLREKLLKDFPTAINIRFEGKCHCRANAMFSFQLQEYARDTGENREPCGYWCGACGFINAGSREKEAGEVMAHDYKQEIRDWFKDDHLDESITDESLFIALDADPEYWERRRAFKNAVDEMIENGELDTYGGQLQFNPGKGR